MPRKPLIAFYVMQIHPQQVLALAISGVLKSMKSFKKLIGAGALITLGIPISSAANMPFLEKKSHTMISG